MVEFFGDVRGGKLHADRYVSKPDLCQYDMKEPGSEDLYWNKGLVLVATYPEILQISRVCERGPDRQPLHYVHVHLHGAVKTPVSYTHLTLPTKA